VEKYLQPERSQMTKWLMYIAWWIPKATNTHLEYVVLIAFPVEQWLHERNVILSLSYNSFLVKIQCHFLGPLLVIRLKGQRVKAFFFLFIDILYCKSWTEFLLAIITQLWFCLIILCTQITNFYFLLLTLQLIANCNT
jgi:hypothetical protein